MRPGDLLERHSDLGALTGALDAAAAGQGAVAVVEGSPGIGKSRLLARVREDARARGMGVGFARGAELERDFGFGVVRQLLGPLLAELAPADADRALGGAAVLAAPLFAPDGAGGPRGYDASYGVLQGLYWLVTELTAGRPLALVVDDLQWADEPSLTAIGFLVRRLEGLPVALVVGTRPARSEGRAELAELVADPDAVVVRPAPLSREAVGGWLAAVSGAEPDPSFAEACRSVTGGNPLLLKELLHELQAEHVAPSADATERVRHLTPRGISTVVLLRLARLPREAGPLARAVAVLGDGALLEEAAALAGLTVAEAATAAAALAGADILEDAAELRFVHPIIRAAVHDDVPAVRRAELHAQAAGLLQERSAPAEQVAAHLLEAGPADLPWAGAVLREAAERALALGDARAAARRLRAALDAAHAHDPAERGELLELLGRAEALDGDPAAAGHLEQAVALAATPDLAADRAVLLGTAHKMAGRGEDAIAALTGALAGLPPGSPGAQRLEAEVVGAGFLDLAAARVARDHVGRLRAPAGPARDDHERLTLAVLAWDAATRPGGTAAEVARLAERVLGRDPAGTNPIPGGQGLVVAGMALVVADRLALAEHLWSDLVDHARRAGAGAATGGALGMRGWTRLRAGRVAEAEADAVAALELCGQARAPAVLANPPLAVLAYVAAERDRPAGGAEATAVEQARDVMSYGLVLHARGRLHAAEGRHDAAVADLRACGRDEPWWGRDLPSLLPWRSDAALSLLALGDRDQARALAGEEVVLARAFGAPRALGIALRAAALMQDDGAARLAGLAEAETVLREAGARVEWARALVDLGAERRRQGERTAAREPLAAALDAAARAGAERLAERAREELLATGARPRRTAGSGVGALTPAERRVADRAAEGLGNREIAQALWLSEKTVETHMSSILRKLGLRSRAEVGRSLDDAVAA